jgi:hypothetical protein
MRGGARPGAGRPKGAVSRMTQKAREEAAAVGMLPHEFLAAVARGEEIDGHLPTFEERVDAAKAAAPFYAPKLAATQVTASITRSHEDMLDELSREGEEIVSGLAH